VTIHSTQPDRRFRGWNEWEQPTIEQKEPAGMGYAVALLMLLALIVLCVAGFFLFRALMPASPPVTLPALITATSSSTPAGTAPQPLASPTSAAQSGQARVGITPDRGYVNTLITVAGQGWWPGEAVFVFLRSPAEGEGRGYAYAAAVADGNGNFYTAFTFPNEVRWRGQAWADVIARGSRSGFEASTRFTLDVPTPTDTSPPPTPRPPLPPTDIPLPTDTPPPTATPFPTFTPTPEVVITDWRGEYFAGITPTGDPVLIRNDREIAFNWGAGSPAAGIPGDRFSARWTRWLNFEKDLYRFQVTVDDGVRLWIDGRLLLDEWHDSSQITYSVEVPLARGQHFVQIEYYENVGGAEIVMTWARVEPATPTSTPTWTPLPTNTPLPTATPPSPPTYTPLPPPTETPPPTAIPNPTPLPPAPWRAEYFANPRLDGPPVLVRDEESLDHNWGAGSPGEAVPADNFSARWTREVEVTAGTYHFFLQADDGARVWVDGLLLLEAWPADPGQTYVIELGLAQGVHIFTVEYFETTGEARIHFWGE